MSPQRYASETDAITSFAKGWPLHVAKEWLLQWQTQNGGYNKRQLAFLGVVSFLSAAGNTSLLAWDSPTKFGVRLKLRLAELHLANSPAQAYPAPMESDRAGRQN